jgi:hypothetical protein
VHQLLEYAKCQKGRTALSLNLGVAAWTLERLVDNSRTETDIRELVCSGAWDLAKRLLSDPKDPHEGLVLEGTRELDKKEKKSWLHEVYPHRQRRKR